MKREARIDNSVVVEYEFSPERAQELADVIAGRLFEVRIGFETPRAKGYDSDSPVADLVLTFASPKGCFDIEIPLLRDDVETLVSDMKFIAFHR